jgi:hypothetical protein
MTDPIDRAVVGPVYAVVGRVYAVAGGPGCMGSPLPGSGRVERRRGAG